MASWLIVRDDDGVCINAIEYDGESPFTPPEGCSLVERATDSKAWIGWRLVDDEDWLPPPAPTVAEDGSIIFPS